MNDQIMEEEMTYKRIKRGVLSLTGVIKEMKIKTTKIMRYHLTPHQSGKKGGLSRVKTKRWQGCRATKTCCWWVYKLLRSCW